ncbi:uncharacterized protein DUF3137 [Maritalea mobilis]|uniref:Uncharacterized protein DUF3137 n=1 Tax=Maritalea mobilis TaxID=483324 RepID=A0A4R6VGF4_9HYPH|nr:DUF3137 domain-containing protein [Maritalea mobilis]TDQ60427.1 uncharacterized protein DUF3137 [Maritalea mobilis]
MSKARTHWDPIEGQISIKTPDLSTIKQGIALPMWLKRILPLAAALSFVGVIIEGMVIGSFPIYSTVAATVFMGAFLLADHFENEHGRKTIRRVKLAQSQNWSYTPDLMERQLSYVASSTSDGIERRATSVKSERAEKIEAEVPELTKVQVGAYVGAYFDGEFWGESREDSLPFWLALGSMQMEAGLAADPNLRRDNFGGQGGYGQFFSLLGAYKIDRKTGVRVVIQPENILHKGPLDRDIKTESMDFNDRFKISGRYLDKGQSQHTPDLEVMRILTPATQDAMLALHHRYHKVGFVLDDDVLYFMAQDKLVGKNAMPDRIDELLCELSREFESAKLGIKPYIE